MRGPDKQPRKRRTAQEIAEARAPKPDEGLGEFAPGRVSVVVSERTEEMATDDSLNAFARDVLRNPQYREGLKARMLAGTATPAETRLMVELGREEAASQKPKSTMAEAMALASTEEIEVLANVSKRFIAKRDGEEFDDRYLVRQPDGRYGRFTLDQVFRLAEQGLRR